MCVVILMHSFMLGVSFPHLKVLMVLYYSHNLEFRKRLEQQERKKRKEERKGRKEGGMKRRERKRREKKGGKSLQQN